MLNVAVAFSETMSITVNVCYVQAYFVFQSFNLQKTKTRTWQLLHIE